jgi:hypothetical protein
MTDTTTLLALVLTRRAIAAAALHDDEFGLYQGRHLTSRQDRVDAVVARYLERLLGQVHPFRVALSAPRAEHGTTSRLRAVICQVLERAGVAVQDVERTDLLAAFSASPLRSRRQVQEVMQQLWPESAHVTGRVAPYVAEAAAVALYADVTAALRSP